MPRFAINRNSGHRAMAGTSAAQREFMRTHETYYRGLINPRDPKTKTYKGTLTRF